MCDDNKIDVAPGELMQIPNSAQMVTVDPSAIAAAEMAKTKIQLAYFMAAQRPRNEASAWSGIMSICKRPAFADRAIYSKPVGGAKINGPSIRLAEEVIRRWGNILVMTQVVFEDDEKRRVSVQVIDLETNVQYSKDIVTVKTVERKNAKGREIVAERENSYGQMVYIVKATEDELHNKEAAAISKAVRNEGLRLIPSDVVDDAVDMCYRTQADRDAEDPEKATKQIIFGFNELGVDVADLEKYLGHAVQKSTNDERVDLRGLRRAIRDGETTWQAAVDLKSGTGPNQTAQQATEATGQAIKDKLNQAKDEGKEGPDVDQERPEPGAGEDTVDALFEHLPDDPNKDGM